MKHTFDLAKFQALITDLKLNNTYFAEKLGINRASFHNKLHGTRGEKFSPEQMDILNTALREITSSINEYLKF